MLPAQKMSTLYTHTRLKYCKLYSKYATIHKLTQNHVPKLYPKPLLYPEYTSVVSKKKYTFCTQDTRDAHYVNWLDRAAVHCLLYPEYTAAVSKTATVHLLYTFCTQDTLDTHYVKSKNTANCIQNTPQAYLKLCELYPEYVSNYTYCVDRVLLIVSRIHFSCIQKKCCSTYFVPNIHIT